MAAGGPTGVAPAMDSGATAPAWQVSGYRRGGDAGDAS